MTVKTILAASIFEPQVDANEADHSLPAFAIQLASLFGAHLDLCLGIGRLTLPSATIVPDVQGLVSQSNQDHIAAATAFGEEALRRAKAGGVTAALDVVTGDYATVAQTITGRARVSDLSIVQPGDRAFSLAGSVTEELLFGSGRPVMVLPSKWGGAARFDRIAVAWDGSAKAARAIGDAVAFIDRAHDVEVVTIAGDANSTKSIAGIDVAPRIARHTKSVRLTSLPCPSGDIAQVLRDHVTMARADLLVMGAYGHTRLREFVLGGVTKSMLDDPPLPVLMSC